MERSRSSHHGIRRRLTLIRQYADKKKARERQSVSQHSCQNNRNLRDRIEREARDAESLIDKSESNLSSTYCDSNQNLDQRDGIEDGIGCHCALSPLFMGEERNEDIISSQEQTALLSSNATFHVRISIGHLTGLKVDEIMKHTKQSGDNRIIVGFVELLSSGKYTALSKPILTNIEDTAEPKIISWANTHDSAEVSTSKSRRCLHFSLSLDRENSEYGSCEDSEDSDDDTTYSYVPEVVRLLVGLKCGDERLPLGIAKFVANGKEASEQNMNLLVLPRSKSKRGIFGKKQRSSFNNGNLSFTLTRDAKLCIKADVKMAFPGQDGAEIWGDADCSYASATKPASYSGGTFPRGLTFSKIKISPLKKKSSRDLLNTQKVNEAPMKYVSTYTGNDLISVSSDISSISTQKVSWGLASLLCGACGGGFSTAQHRVSYEQDHSSRSSETDESELSSVNDELRSINLSGESSYGIP